MIQKTFRVVIVDDHELLSESLGVWFSRQKAFELVGCAKDGEAGLSLCLDTKPDLALVDVELPKLDGLELVALLKEKLPALRLLSMSGRTDPFTIWRVSRSGAHGFVDKMCNPSILLEAITRLTEGGTYFSEVFEEVKKNWLSQPEAFQKILSDREQEVLRRVVAGWDEQRISEKLGITVSTVAVHRKNIRQKLELHNDRELVAYARKWGLDRSAN